MKKPFAIGLAAGLLVAALPPQATVSAQAAAAPAAILSQANAALQAGEADKAISMLRQLPNGGAKDAQAMNIACRVEFTLAHWDAAVRNCQQAVRLDPQSSDNHMWLGRAYGEKADKASFLSAFSLGKKVLSEFQRAAQLDSRNAEALSDLGEFYIEAPGVVGGGADKAESVAKELDRMDPVRAAAMRAAIASQRGDYGTAESFLKRALAISRHPARQWAALARFYGARGRWAELDNAIRNCEAAASHDSHAAVAFYDAAGLLIRYKRDPAFAAKLLEQYLASPYKTEEAPAFIAYARLANVQQKLGDAANAQIALAAASELAREYQPAQDLRR